MEFWTSFGGQMILRGAAASVPDSYDALVQSAVNAERLGFDGIVASEHHFEYNKFLPSPLQSLAAAASATSKIRLLTGAMLLPLYDPIRATEMACTIDVLSNGRLTLGLGMGYRPMEFDGMALAKSTRGARLTEAMEIIRAATSAETFSYAGKHYQYKDLRVTPRPVQKPIDMWFCGGTSSVAAQRAGRSGFGYWLANSPIEVIKHIMGVYHDAGAKAGYGQDQLKVAVFRDFFVGDTVQEAKDARQWYLDCYYNEHIRCYGYLADDEGNPLYNPPFDHPAYLKFVDSLFVGTYDMAIEELKRIEKLGARSVTVPPIQLDAFSKHIIPEFRKTSA